MTTHETNGKILLLLEDDGATRQALAVLLRHAGYVVILAAHGREALDILRHAPPPNAVLLDLVMPVLDGEQFLRQLKALPFLAAIPILVVTGSILTPQWAQAHGCAGLLHKPIEPEVLLQEVQRCVA